MSSEEEGMNEIYERVIDRLQSQEESEARGLSTRDVVAQNYSDEDFERLVEQLKDRADDFTVPFRLASFIIENQQERIPEPLRWRAADYAFDRIPDSALQTLNELVLIFAIWGQNRTDHSKKCCAFLNHPNGEVREVALRCCPVFLQRSEYPTLFRFRDDPSHGETMGMGGPLRFTLRDEALSTLEELTGAPKSVGDCFEIKPQGKVSYRSWSPFLKWFDRHKGEFRD